MSDPLLHPITKQRIDEYIAQPSHAVLISAPAGAGKYTVAQYIAGELLGLEPTALSAHPYAKLIAPADGKALTIEQIRELNGFLSRRVPGNKRRVIIVDSAHTMAHEAQNAMLKTLEEPPEGTYLLLTSSAEQALLPTLRSRVTKIALQRPASDAAVAYFADSGFSEQQIQQALLMSGGWPGIIHALLHEEHDHPMFAAVAEARRLIQATQFERLAMVDTLSKDKDLSLRLLAVLQQMSHVALSQGRTPLTWQRILQSAYKATEELLGNGQPKLVLTNLMLSL